MQGVDPLGYLRQVSVVLDQLQDRASVERVLDEVEYLYEVMDPELQYLADEVMQKLRARLETLS